MLDIAPRLIGVCVCSVSVALAASVYISEIMPNPPGSDDAEWLELHNPSENVQSLDGWKLTDGINFTFNNTHVLGPDERLVVTRNRGAFNKHYPTARSAGTFSGKLGNLGDTVVLRMPDNSIVDLVSYGMTGTWPRSVNGAGSSLERIEVTVPAVTMTAWAPSPLSSIWRRIEIKGRLRGSFLTLQLLTPGTMRLDNIEVVPGDTATNAFPAGDFESGGATIVARGQHQAVVITDADAHLGSNCLQITATRRTGSVRITLPRLLARDGPYRLSFWVQAQGDAATLAVGTAGGGRRVVTIMDEWPYGGSPGRANVHPVESACGLEITSVAHTPVFPAAGQAVCVQALLASTDSACTVSVECRTGEQGQWQTVVMQPVAGAPGLYQAEVAAPAVGSFIEYAVSARGARTVRVPHAHDTPSVRRIYAVAAEDAPRIPAVGVWMDEVRPGVRGRLSDNLYRPCTLVDGSGFYPGARVRASKAFQLKRGNKRGLIIKFARGFGMRLFRDDVQEEEALLHAMIGDVTYLREYVAQTLFSAAGVPAATGYHVRTYLNGGDYGLHYLMERVNEDFVEKHGLPQPGGIIKPEDAKGLDPRKCVVQWESSGVKTMDALARLFRAMTPLPRRNPTTLSNRQTAVLHLLDTTAIVKYLAVNVILQQQAALDNYFFGYLDAGTGRWLMLPSFHEKILGWRPNGINVNDQRVTPFFGSRAQRPAGKVSVLNDALFWPNSGAGAEYTAAFRAEQLNVISTIVSRVLLSGDLAAAVTNTAAAIEHEAVRDWQRVQPGVDARARYTAAVADLIAFLQARAAYLRQHDADWR